MNREDIIRMAQESGLFIAYDTEGHFSGVVDSEMIDMYPDQNKERDRLNREQRFVEILTPFAALVASAAQAKEREACHALRQTLPNPYDHCQVSAHAHDMAIVAYGAAIRARGQA